MPTVELLLSPRPHHVRTARLVGVAAARRAGLPDELVDELRWALGEACSRAVALHAAHAPDVPVRILLREDTAGLTVEVIDHGPQGLPPEGTDPEALFGSAVQGSGHNGFQDGLQDDHADEGVDPRVSLAVLGGLVDDIDVTSTEAGTTVRLRWPLPVRTP
ncbi:MAG: anti-sigma regulatory factor [Frankiales bacterium]|nr:anti-sigma regulatory factor [Frankiales bacterium]MCW2707557.1 anti-sigma regulatory factor [Frankiales bacterium]